MSDLSIEILGEELVLTCSGVVWLPAFRALLVADLHLGKDATFRAAGIPVPSGSTTETLASLSSISQRFNAEQVFVLGDLWHHQASEALEDWLITCAVEVHLVPGNHDRKALKQLHPKGLNVLPEVCELGPFKLRHDPSSNEGFAICGHLHPVISLDRRHFPSQRARCYWQTQTSLILPSFGNFTGGSPITPTPGDRIYLCASDRVVELPARR